MRVAAGPEREVNCFSAGANALVPRRGMPNVRSNEVFMMIVGRWGCVAMNAHWLHCGVALLFS